MPKKILVTGATGTIGSQVAEQLVERGADVRVAVRSPEKVRLANTAGTELTAFDWDDAASYARAFEGVDRVLLLSPFIERFVPYVERAVAAAKAAGVGHIVRLSAIGADADAPGVGREHGQAEQRVRESGLGWTVLQPTFFVDNAATYQRDALAGQGAFYGASHGGRVAYVASTDIAAVAVAALLEPEAHAGQTYVLTGGEALRDEELAEILGEVLGREVRYVDLEETRFAEGLRAQGTPEWMVEHLVAFEGMKAQGWAAEVSPAVERALGRAPLDAKRALARYASSL